MKYHDNSTAVSNGLGEEGHFSDETPTTIASKVAHQSTTLGRRLGHVRRLQSKRLAPYVKKYFEMRIHRQISPRHEHEKQSAYLKTV